MKTDNILEVDNLSKLYSRSDGSTRKRISSAFSRALFWRAPKPPTKLETGEFWSLKNINFSLKRGEAVGIIGFNGAGKTTLLRILSGQILPDAGEVRISGKSAAMIDLTAGFNVNASGRRNIYLRGASLGHSSQFLEEHEQEIVEFSELGDAIDAPFGTYSSGMRMRLAFSIMLISQPDILFIDEILSVGDFRFRQKCLNKIRQLREVSAFVLVSHSMDDISRFCDHVLVLNRGVVVFEGEPEDCIEYYLKQVDVAMPSSREVKLKKILGDFHTDESTVSDVEHYWCDSKGNKIDDIRTNQNLYFKCSFNLKKPVRHLTLGVPIWTEDGHYVTGFGSKTQSPGTMPCKLGQNEYLLHVPRQPMNSGVYLSNIVVRDGPGYIYRQPNKKLQVITAEKWHFGSVSVEHKWIKTNDKA